MLSFSKVEIGFRHIICEGFEYKLSMTDKVYLAYFRSLFRVHNSPFELSQEEIADDLGVDRKTVQRIHARLSKAGILRSKKVKCRNYLTWLYCGISSYTGNHPKYGDVSLPEILLEDIPSALDKSSSLGFYVYLCTKDGVPIYVGKGKRDRIKHCLSGSSSNAELNKAFHECGGVGMSVDKIHEDLSERQALDIEVELIKSLTSSGVKLYNRQHNY